MQTDNHNNISAVCLTGDVHHMSMKLRDQKYLKTTEAQTALEYVKIAKDNGIKTTLFMTGKTVQQEKDICCQLAQFDECELAGHNYFAFNPRLPFKISKKIFKRANGPGFYQNWEIKKTKHIFQKLLGTQIVSWRNHAYRHDKNTYQLLAKNSIKYCSDILAPENYTPYKSDNLIHIPINTTPDHDYMYHGWITQQTASEIHLQNSPFGNLLVTPEKWLENIKQSTEKIISAQGLATILAHPSCMQIADDFSTFKKLCSFLSKFKTIKVNEVEI